MSFPFCLLTHRKGNFTLQRLYHFSYRFIQEWPLDMGMGPHWWGQASIHYPITPLQTHSFEAHLGAPSRLPGCLSCPAPPNSSQFIALKSTPLPCASAPTTAASAYGALRGPHRSSHEPSQPSTAGVTGTPLWVTLIFQGLCVKALDCDPYSSRTTLRSGSAPPEPTSSAEPTLPSSLISLPHSGGPLGPNTSPRAHLFLVPTASASPRGPFLWQVLP